MQECIAFLSENSDKAYSRGKFLETDCLSCFLAARIIQIDPLVQNVDFSFAEVSEAHQ
jgi:hypothetical protein